jgi:hypothetical protein
MKERAKSKIRFWEKFLCIVFLLYGASTMWILKGRIVDWNPITFIRNIKDYIIFPSYREYIFSFRIFSFREYLFSFLSGFALFSVSLYGLFPNVTAHRAFILSGACFSVAILLIVLIIPLTQFDWSILHAYYMPFIFMGALFHLHWGLLKSDIENDISGGET